MMTSARVGGKIQEQLLDHLVARIKTVPTNFGDLFQSGLFLGGLFLGHFSHVFTSLDIPGIGVNVLRL
jgi:hypothetical protein